ncbi:hypothetical protein [Mucilaginibacter segetis]|uniref:Uncharacterized protein n=1 Tax=Mucilaginibacter segetis TaxID=2793071 RepID=A0A934PQE6_9SPHI|nr:hypothetical protein [Mucilaginibacter segetis]MBK0378843.1 hypothetical protein [Mucilaginibacter segetis]
MDNQQVELQSRMYLYDLMNAAKEHGFKQDDSWEFSMVSDSGRSSIQKNYYPTIAVKIMPEILLQVFHTIKSRLNQTFSKDERQFQTKNIEEEDLNFLVAYNLKRPRG